MEWPGISQKLGWKEGSEEDGEKNKKIERGKRPGKGGALRVSFFSSLD